MWEVEVFECQKNLICMTKENFTNYRENLSNMLIYIKELEEVK